ncbi:MAG: transglutaminase-like domain-containing protein, partial [Lachnospiraceae bacterium]|nr:transglutaminase-like domain-containing protein [Lachnospiraceae bacterium]
IEPDSAAAIHSRLLADFSLSLDEGLALIQEQHPQVTMDSLRDFASKHYVEIMEIDGVKRMHKKSPRNINLLNPAYNGGWKMRGATASPKRVAYADSVLRCAKGELADGGKHRVRMKFEIDVPFDSALIGDTLRVWMPYPMEADRQTGVTLAGASRDYIISTPAQSMHSTIYMEAPVDTAGNHFEYEAEFTACGAYVAPERILADIKPYDMESEEYQRHTAFDNPHIIPLDSLAKTIVGGETNPYKCSELVYDYIIRRYPWAGAREYSTIPCMPQYVMDEGHGDCGQVSLLYISLMRSLGIPARWESGWMLHPGEKNLHDWAEVYFEGIGWVPVDVSFGRYINCPDKEIEKFYSTGIDSHRFVANKGVSGAFYPAKKYVRSETVDAQLGEVECTRGNLFYPAWDCKFTIISQTPIK